MTKNIRDAVCLLPELIADSVCQEAARYLQSDAPIQHIGALVDRTDRIYAANPRFRRQMKRADGRDLLYSFMRHWLAALLSQDNRRAFEALPSSFANGVPLPTQKAA